MFTTESCFHKYTMDFDFFDGPCFSLTLSKCLGFGIILGSILVKLPQIIKILGNRSGEGISVLSVTLDLTAITIYATYSFRKSFPFSAWGDAGFLAIQTVAIAFLVLLYKGSILLACLYFLLYIGVTAVLVNANVTSLELLWSLQGCNIFIVLSGKLTQALVNYKNGHTGNLSAITLTLLLFGSLARIFTSIQETGDFVVILTYISSTLANGVVLAQLFYYWNATEAKLKAKTD